MAIAVFPIPVGPKTAITRTGGSIAGAPRPTGCALPHARLRPRSRTRVVSPSSRRAAERRAVSSIVNMAVHIGTGLSLVPDARTGALEAAAAAANALHGNRCDLAIVFASGAHLGAPETTLDA